MEFPSKNEARNLHIGGLEVKSGWKILNILDRPGVDYRGDISDLSQFADNSWTCIYASHVLEHVPQGKVMDTLVGIHRILEPGGAFCVSVPDMDILCSAYISPFATRDVKFHIMRMMFGGQVDSHDYHHFGWNRSFMTEFLSRAGFSSIRQVENFGIFSDTSDYRPYGFPISLNMIALK